MYHNMSRKVHRFDKHRPFAAGERRQELIFTTEEGKEKESEREAKPGGLLLP